MFRHKGIIIGIEQKNVYNNYGEPVIYFVCDDDYTIDCQCKLMQYIRWLLVYCAVTISMSAYRERSKKPLVKILMEAVIIRLIIMPGLEVHSSHHLKRIAK
jgi:hypothetical protein